MDQRAGPEAPGGAGPGAAGRGLWNGKPGTGETLEARSLSNPKAARELRVGRRPGSVTASSPVALHSRARLNSLREAELCGPVLQVNPGTLAAEIG